MESFLLQWSPCFSCQSGLNQGIWFEIVAPVSIYSPLGFCRFSKMVFLVLAKLFLEFNSLPRLHTKQNFFNSFLIILIIFCKCSGIFLPLPVLFALLNSLRASFLNYLRLFFHQFKRVLVDLLVIGQLLLQEVLIASYTCLSAVSFSK